MSCVELHTGTLTKINTKGLTVEEYCEYLCKKYGYEIAYEGDTYAAIDHNLAKRIPENPNSELISGEITEPIKYVNNRVQISQELSLFD